MRIFKNIMAHIGAAAIPVILIILSGCSGENQEQAAEQAGKAISVKGQEVGASSKKLTKSFTGTLEGEKQTVIRAKISEAVEKIYVSEGGSVKVDDVIVGLEKTGPSSNYIQSRSVYQNAEKNYKKMQFLFEEGAISEAQYDASKTEYEVARANFEAARQMVELRTPVAGTVTSINVSVGDYVSPGEQMAVVAKIDRLRMKLGVNGDDVKFFDIGDSVTVYTEKTGGRSLKGEVLTVASSADPVTRTFQVEIQIDNRDHVFKPGMFARAEIVIEKFEDILVIPRASVLNRNEKDYLFLIRDSSAVLRDIVLGAEFDGFVQVTSGLRPGDTIVVTGQNYLEDGSKIKMVRFVNTAGEEVEL